MNTLSWTILNKNVNRYLIEMAIELFTPHFSVYSDRQNLLVIKCKLAQEFQLSNTHTWACLAFPI